MTFVVAIKPNNYTIFVEPNETVLDAALRQGYDFPYSCRSATCATCIGKVLSGQIAYGDVEPYALDEAAQADGFALFCSAQPQSDLVIEVEDVFGPECKPVRTADYKIDNHTLLSGSIHQVLLSPVTDKNISYIAGQYLTILGTDNTAVPFSIANAPVNGSQQIELHIHDAPQSVHCKAILDKFIRKENLTLKGPYGRMIYRPEPKLPIIFVANGTGVVPFKAIIENSLANNDNKQAMHLYWSVKDQQRLYLNELFTRWAKHIPQFSYIPVIGEPVHEIVLKDFPDLSGYQVFASGSPNKVCLIKKAFLEQGLKPYCIYSDTFDFSMQGIDRV